MKFFHHLLTSLHLAKFESSNFSKNCIPIWGNLKNTSSIIDIIFWKLFSSNFLLTCVCMKSLAWMAQYKPLVVMPAFNWYLKHWKLSYIYTPFINFKSWHDCFSSLSRAIEIPYWVVARVLNCQEIFLDKGIYSMRNIFSSIQFKTGSWVRQGCSYSKAIT